MLTANSYLETGLYRSCYYIIILYYPPAYRNLETGSTSLVYNHLTFLITGKSYFAKAIAGEAQNATFMEIKMNDILSCYRGTSENNIVAMFDLAEILQPTIIFIGKYMHNLSSSVAELAHAPVAQPRDPGSNLSEDRNYFFFCLHPVLIQIKSVGC